MNLPSPSITGVLAVLVFSSFFPGCRKENQNENSSHSRPEKALSAEDEEANQKKATIQLLQLQEKDFRSRLEAAKAGVAKQGNKTRKKLKPEMASLDAKSVRLDSLIRNLPDLSGPDLKPSVALLNATLDSANAELAHVRKFLK